jgi:hypothetical protein
MGNAASASGSVVSPEVASVISLPRPGWAGDPHHDRNHRQFCEPVARSPVVCGWTGTGLADAGSGRHQGRVGGVVARSARRPRCWHPTALPIAAGRSGAPRRGRLRASCLPHRPRAVRRGPPAAVRNALLAWSRAGLMPPGSCRRARAAGLVPPGSCRRARAAGLVPPVRVAGPARALGPLAGGHVSCRPVVRLAGGPPLRRPPAVQRPASAPCLGRPQGGSCNVLAGPRRRAERPRPVAARLLGALATAPGRPTLIAGPDQFIDDGSPAVVRRDAGDAVLRAAAL